MKNYNIKQIEQELKDLSFKVFIAKKFLKASILSKIDFNLIDYTSYFNLGG